MQNKPRITLEQLNNAYLTIINGTKEGKIDKQFPALYTYKDTELEFKFNPKVGSKGAWFVVTDLEVIDLNRNM